MSVKTTQEKAISSFIRSRAKALFKMRTDHSASEARLRRKHEEVENAWFAMIPMGMHQQIEAEVYKLSPLKLSGEMGYVSEPSDPQALDEVAPEMADE